MTEKQQEAIDRLKKGTTDIWFSTLYGQEEMDEDISIVLDLIFEMQTEISKKDHEIKRMNKYNYELDRESQKYFDAYMDSVSDIYGKDMEINILAKMLFCCLKFMKHHNLTIDNKFRTCTDKDEAGIKYLKEKVKNKVENKRNEGLYEQ